ncbi:peptide/nickel transport system ATP-binding protein [Maridesulfovibrio ferrireducens]|uniref:Peptide/nickel transport system ATP-binding protein n=1 Tax=Maridesulfovibrio ferrireducens TaxID=246191 RepID=A0A1G9LGS8_9BACT|nr:ABC transporter ATP-binding protein [Maridesulfovibrio ferrireducens]SDL61152.1 peptide/nickel transport system ATP-binding protein [Maridesulfovibrio ferrireducens]
MLNPKAANAEWCAMSQIADEILRVERIGKNFTTGLIRRTKNQALKDVSFSLSQNKCLAIIGESGSGKTTIGRIILGAEKPTSGTVYCNGKDIFSNKKSFFRNDTQMIPQDATASLNPTMKVRDLLLEPFKITRTINGNRDILIEKSLETGKLTRDLLDRYPHELSGGQRQRIAIARTLSLDPSLIIADEPAASLDRSIQAHVLSILKEKVEENNKSLILITHDLRSMRLMADYVAVLYYGHIVEYGTVSNIIDTPCHPYTKALVSSVLGLKPGSERIKLKGESPSPSTPPSGCPFHPRCINSVKSCTNELPPLREINKDHMVRCCY